MTALPHGFTGFSHRDPHFVSAGDALRGSRYDDTPFAARKQAQARNLAEAWSPAGAERVGAGLAAEGGYDAVARGAGARPLSQLSSAASDVLRFAEQGTAAAGAPRFDPDKLARIPEVDRRWAWVEIDLNAIRHNASAVKQRLNPGTRLMAVVKADGYGHGAVQCAKTALNSGAEYLGVATVDEAIALREAYVNAPILILGEPPATAIPLLLAYKIMPAVYTAEFAIRYAEAADAFGVSAPFHLKVNTGMNRIGVRWDEVVEFAVGRGTALQHIGDVDVLAGQPGDGQKLVEVLAGGAHERLALQILVLARSLADDEHPGLGIAHPEHRLRAAIAQGAAAAGGHLGLQVF